jgi:hypothetical protein
MRRAWQALAAYTAITLVATWPLARGLGRDVAWDLGDSVLVMWALAWDAEQMLGILRGEFSRVATFFDANIFHPAPLTLAYSEHFIAQAVQILPIYAVTNNPILCYNLLFLSTFILSGLGTYLLVRELTGRPWAAFVAGLLFAFAPYRIPQSPHLHVLSAQWMPLALYGLRRYIDSVDVGTPRWRPLGGAGLALVVQNLSCGYYLLYFSPVAAAYVAWELVRRGLWRHVRVWASLAAAAALVLGLTAPFLIPYLRLNEQLRFERSRSEVIRYSADVYSFVTAGSDQLWGKVLRTFPKPEADLFPGAVPLLLALAGLVWWRQDRPPVATPSPASSRHRWLPPLLAALALLHVVAALVALANRRITIDLWLFDVQISNITQMLLRAAILAALWLALSPAARLRARAALDERAFFAAAFVMAAWLSLGPVVQVLGRPAELAAPYAFLFEYVPGFEGVRVPARFGMVIVLMLAVLGGYGAAALLRWRHAPILLAMLCLVFMAETVVLPFTVNGVTPPRGYNAPEPRLYRPERAPAVYHEIARLPPGTVLAELPLGEPDFDIRAMFYSIVHWRPLLNGYSGFYPPHYGRLALALSDAGRFPDAALAALRTQGATHVLVHEDAYLDGRGGATTAALRGGGAVELYRSGGDVLLQLP